MADSTTLAKPRNGNDENTAARKTAKKPRAPRLSAAASRAAEAQQVESNLGALQSLPDFLATTGQLTNDERALIVDQALYMIENYYVHLPLKRAMHAIDPVQRLKLLKQHQAELSERAFLDEMIAIYIGLRDLHTNFILPEPYNARTAFVPIRIEEFYENGERQYMVTQVSPILKDPNLKPGVIVTHWNNIPIDRAVEINAEREAGSNLAARHARGLESLTQRWMGMALPPDEEKVALRYTDANGKTFETLCDWIVYLPDAPATGVDPRQASGSQAYALGIDLKTEMARRTLKVLFSPKSMEMERVCEGLDVQAVAAGAAAAPPGVDLTKTSTMPDIFSDFRAVQTPSGTFGYVRIRSFNVNSDDDFLAEFIRIVSLLPQNGLIIDVRGNGGGLIMAGERLLQLLTPGPIEPERFHFLNTPLTLDLCNRFSDLAPWKESIEESVELGTEFSQGFPLLPIENYNSIGQIYQGPIVLIIDALCYSTTDIFTAGFKDHKIGKILGASGNTGAGGANVWTYELLQQLYPGSDTAFKPLPKGTSFRVAIRRTTRVGENMGVPVEDLGVIPDELHEMTKNDVINGNVDLINHAGQLLAAEPVYRLQATLAASTDGTAHVQMTTQNITRVDAFVNGRPRATLDVADNQPATVDLPAAKGALIELRGYNKDDVLSVAARLGVA